MNIYELVIQRLKSSLLCESHRRCMDCTTQYQIDHRLGSFAFQLPWPISRLPSHSYFPCSSDMTVVPLVVVLESRVTYKGMNKNVAVEVEGERNTSMAGIWSPADAGRLENAEAGGVLFVKSGIDEDGGYEKVEGGTTVDSSSCCEGSVRLECEIEESGSVGVEVVCKLVRECELAECSMVSV